VAVQGQQGTQPEGTFLNLINWIGNVIAPVGAGGAALMAIGSFAMGRGFGKWVFTAIGLLMVSGVTATARILDCPRHRRSHLNLRLGRRG